MERAYYRVCKLTARRCRTPEKELSQLQFRLCGTGCLGAHVALQGIVPAVPFLQIIHLFHFIEQYFDDHSVQWRINLSLLTLRELNENTIQSEPWLYAGLWFPSPACVCKPVCGLRRIAIVAR